MLLIQQPKWQRRRAQRRRAQPKHNQNKTKIIQKQKQNKIKPKVYGTINRTIRKQANQQEKPNKTKTKTWMMCFGEDE